mmetsp:Transcript_69858/g.116403  ORF Transcript_69858/g.116403 Transcript_69858/m.116403 type:complete len:100 (-) Transcript_69858:268-567(-)
MCKFSEINNIQQQCTSLNASRGERWLISTTKQNTQKHETLYKSCLRYRRGALILQTMKLHKLTGQDESNIITTTNWKKKENIPIKSGGANAQDFNQTAL